MYVTFVLYLHVCILKELLAHMMIHKEINDS